MAALWGEAAVLVPGYELPQSCRATLTALYWNTAVYRIPPYMGIPPTALYEDTALYRDTVLYGDTALLGTPYCCTSNDILKSIYIVLFEEPRRSKVVFV